MQIPFRNIDWVDVFDKDMPLDDQGILVSHPAGVEYIVWYNRQWCYCYSDGRPIGDLYKTITHWCKPQRASRNPGGSHGD